MPIIGKELHNPPPFVVLDRDDYELMPEHIRMRFVQLIDDIFEQGVDENQIKVVAQSNWDYPSFRGIYADFLFERDRTEEGLDILKKAIKDFPDDLTLKCIAAIAFMDVGMIAEAEALMDDWIDIDNKKNHKEVYLNTFELLVTFLASYYAEVEDDENLETVYSWTLDDKYESICFGLSYKLVEGELNVDTLAANEFDPFDVEFKNLDDDDFLDDDDDDFEEEDDDNFSEEEDEIDDDELLYDLNYYKNLKLENRPYHLVFQEILDSNNEKLSEDIILNIDRLPKDDNLIHDINWLVKHALDEALEDDVKDVHPIWHALMIVGAKQVSECVPLFIELFYIGEGAAEYIFDDDEYFFVAQYLGHLLDEHESLVEGLLKNTSIDWFHRSTFFRIIGLHAHAGHPIFNIQYIKNLAEHYYQQADVESFTWLRMACMDNELLSLKSFFIQDQYRNLHDEMICDFEDFKFTTPTVIIDWKYDTLAIAHKIYTQYFEKQIVNIDTYISHYTSEAMTDEEDDFKEMEESPIWNIIRSNAMMAIGDFLFNPDDNAHNDSSEGHINDILETKNQPLKYDKCPCGSGKDYNHCCLNMN